MDKKKGKIKFVNVAAAVLLLICIIGIAAPNIYAQIQWNIQFKEFKNREYEMGNGTIKEAVESGYYEEVEMEYIEQDGISAKIDSLIITDDYFEAKVNFKFAEGIEINSETFSFGFAVYDEQKNIYGVSTRFKWGEYQERDYYTPFMYEELGVKYDKNDIFAIQIKDRAGLGNVSATDRNIISKFHMGSNKGFPKSNKVYIRVFDLGYYMLELDEENRRPIMHEHFTISDAEWIFEIEVPEKFYNRKTTELTLKDEIPGLEIGKIEVTEIGLKLNAKIEGLNDIVSAGKDMSMEEWDRVRKETINITDEDGKVYYETDMGTMEEQDWFKFSYEISKNMLNKKLFLNIKINGEQYSSELVEK